MRTNSDDSRVTRGRFFASKKPSLTWAMTSSLFILPSDGPEAYMLDAGGVTRQVRLPSVTEELFILIANIGSSGNLEIYTSGAVLQTLVKPGWVKYFFCNKQGWTWLTGNYLSDEPSGFLEELRQVTAAGAQTISASEAGIVINKAVASATPIALPAVASRIGKPVRIVDWKQTTSAANPATVTPNGVEKIMNQASWIFEGLGYEGVLLFPHTGLSGWTIGA